jgi:invasion protein IalB
MGDDTFLASTWQTCFEEGQSESAATDENEQPESVTFLNTTHTSWRLHCRKAQEKTVFSEK